MADCSLYVTGVYASYLLERSAGLPNEHPVEDAALTSLGVPIRPSPQLKASGGLNLSQEVETVKVAWRRTRNAKCKARRSKERGSEAYITVIRCN